MSNGRGCSVNNLFKQITEQTQTKYFSKCFESSEQDVYILTREYLISQPLHHAF